MTEANPLGNEIANLFTGVGVQGSPNGKTRSGHLGIYIAAVFTDDTYRPLGVTDIIKSQA